MTIYTIKSALEIWFNGFIAGVGCVFMTIVVYVCYKSLEKQELKKKREAKKFEEEKKRKKRARKK